MIIIDRFEGNYAICECDNKIIKIDKNLIIDDASEGDCLSKTENGYTVNRELTKDRQKKILDLQNKLWE